MKCQIISGTITTSKENKEDLNTEDAHRENVDAVTNADDEASANANLNDGWGSGDSKADGELIDSWDVVQVDMRLCLGVTLHQSQTFAARFQKYHVLIALVVANSLGASFHSVGVEMN